MSKTNGAHYMIRLHKETGEYRADFAKNMPMRDGWEDVVSYGLWTAQEQATVAFDEVKAQAKLRVDVMNTPKVSAEEAKPEIFELNLARYATADSAAKALAKHLGFVAKSLGSRASEISLLNPKESAKAGYSKHWRVMWESGPEDWGVRLSLGEPEIQKLLRVSGFHGRDWFLEPHYGFDVGFSKE